MENTVEAINKSVNFLFYFILVLLYFVYVLKLRRAKVDFFCRIWTMFSIFYIALGTCNVMLHFIPQIIYGLPSMIVGDNVEAALRTTIKFSAFNALPNLIFWHNGLPYLEIPEWVPVEELAGLPPKEELAKKRKIWQTVCFCLVSHNFLIGACCFYALQH